MARHYRDGTFRVSWGEIRPPCTLCLHHHEVVEEAGEAIREEKQELSNHGRNFHTIV